MLRASLAAERAGYPSVTIIATPFLKLAHHVAKGLGMEGLPIAEYQGVPMIDSTENLRRTVREVTVPRIISGLTSQNNTRAVKEAEPKSDEIVFRGTLQEVQDFFYARLWTDGLPIMPPTRQAVEEMLKFTDRPPSDVIGVLPPENRQATVWNTAVTGVMAGCRPEYMPVLLAVVEAVADPAFRIVDAGSTPGWEPLIVVNGPIVKELEFNHGTGAMRAGRQANTSIGRFLKLYMRNIAGFRIPPGEGDKGTIGGNFNVALAEDEDTVAELAWKSFSVGRGFEARDSVVTVQGVLYITPPILSGGDSANDHLQTLSEVFGQLCSYRAYIGIKNKQYCPLLVLAPSVARVIAKDGLAKDDIKTFLYEHAKMPADTMERYAWASGHTTYSLRALVAEGEIPQEYFQSDDPKRLVRIFVKPEMIGILVAGDVGRNQSKGYVINHIHGAPVSKKIVLPSGWNPKVNLATPKTS
ncbi:MAG: hypothetical protein HY525_01360 [Betaproteobacteria bacterium]|nr:hypothetical protein [Betaproteobacteria bacterium]